MPTDTTHNINEVKILPPCTPTKIVAVGLNYREHAEEMNRDLPKDPRLFIKPSTAVIGHEDTVIYPDHMSSRVDYEGELAVVIGRTAKDVNVDEALDYVFGYTCLNDITARDLQAKDIQFTKGLKGLIHSRPSGLLLKPSLIPLI